MPCFCSARIRSSSSWSVVRVKFSILTYPVPGRTMKACRMLLVGMSSRVMVKCRTSASPGRVTVIVTLVPFGPLSRFRASSIVISRVSTPSICGVPRRGPLERRDHG